MPDCCTVAGISAFRWDINIRKSTVLGVVGARDMLGSKLCALYQGPSNSFIRHP